MYRILLVALLVSLSFTTAEAANTPPPGSNGQVMYNNNGQWGAEAVVPIATGGTSATTAQGALNNFYTYPSLGAPLGTASPIIAPCTGNDFQNLPAAFASAISQHTNVTIGNGCTLFNGFTLQSGQNSVLVGLQPGNYENAAGEEGNAPEFNFNMTGLAASTSGSAGIDTNGPNAFVMNGVNAIGETANAFSAGVSTSAQHGGFGQNNMIQINNGGFDKMHTAVGCATDDTYQCSGAGGVTSTKGTIVTGSLYTAGTYFNVPLTGGTGSGAAISQLTISGSGLIDASAVAPGGYRGHGFIGGRNYKVGDVLSVSNAGIGGTGSGFTFTVTGVLGAGIVTGVSIANAGSGYTPGGYTPQMTNGSNAGVTLHVTVGGGGTVTAISPAFGWEGYNLSDTLTPVTPFGGGTGFQATVTTISPASYNQLYIPRFSNAGIGDSNCGLCGKFSDTIWGNVVVGGNFGPTVFGQAAAEGNQYSNGRSEFQGGFWYGSHVNFTGVNGSTNSSGGFYYLNDWAFTGTINGPILDYGHTFGAAGQSGSVMMGIHLDRLDSSLPYTAYIGGYTGTSGDNSAIDNFTAIGWSAQSGTGMPTTALIDIGTGVTNPYIQGVNVGTIGIKSVHFSVVPARYFVDNSDFHAENGDRPIGIGTSAPVGIGTAVIDMTNLHTALGLPVGTTGTRPASPITGLIRVNTTTPALEAYYNSTWNSLTPPTGALTPTSIHASAFISITPQPLTISGAAVATDTSLGNYFYVTLTHSASTAVSAPTNPLDGETLTYEFTQDGTGTNVVGWNAIFDFGTSGAPTLTTTAGAVDLIGFRYSSRLTKWLYTGSQLGF